MLYLNVFIKISVFKNRKKLQKPSCELHCGFMFQMTNPSVQNDFSYYRRTLSRMKMSASVSVSCLFGSDYLMCHKCDKCDELMILINQTRRMLWTIVDEVN